MSRTRIGLAALTALLIAASPAVAEEPACAAAAAGQALKLLKFHTNGDDRAAVFADRVKSLGTIKALRGKGRLDVIEVPGAVYKADYRMRLIYAQIPGECVLMGQEILEASDPY
ncbi:hypothetical protein GGR16_001029 [Chelatococcus caeni]|uniref:Uncharacterized protein n=1 Tax=Chelatococcus caeni TaxID=1348468 RepID=A0A840BTW9_9HYPH|nr:hypothetical protein [Chelatococcus caeni]MBB4016023.1 hypothetical protein [Chelatococcus caeni]